jgi:hypothetical protein
VALGPQNPGHVYAADLPALSVTHAPASGLAGSAPWRYAKPSWDHLPKGSHRPKPPPATLLARRGGPRSWGFAAELLSAYREDAGMTQRDLARATGYALSMVKRVEAGYLEPTPESVDRFAAVLGIDWWALTWA